MYFVIEIAYMHKHLYNKRLIRLVIQTSL